jgi:uncharacterized RDD family membrane protein YckC
VPTLSGPYGDSPGRVVRIAFRTNERRTPRVTQLDTTIEIVTPENIAFRYQLAGPFRRVFAFLIDFAVRASVIVLVAMVLGCAGAVVGFLGLAVVILSYFVLEWFYGALFETFWNGQTPGKRLMGIRVLTTSGQPINGLQAVLRNVLRFADAMPPITPAALGLMPVVAWMVPTFLLGLLVTSMNRRYQRLGDLVCGTMVVIEESSWLLGIQKVEDPRAIQLAGYLPPTYQVSRSLAKALATYVERRKYFSLPRRREIARHLGEPLLREFGFPADTSHDLLLCALYYRTFVTDKLEGAPSDRGGTASGSPFATTAAWTPPLQWPPPAAAGTQGA